MPTEPSHPRALDPVHDFDEPWQAQAHAMSQVLQDRGLIDASAWSGALAAALKARLARGDADTTETYYAAMTDALEIVLAVDRNELNTMTEAWRQAYLATPHGEPVTLAAQQNVDV